MKYVIDSSVAFKWVVPELFSDKAQHLRDDCLNAIHDLLSVDIFAVEIAHALTRAERQLRITAGQALDLWTDVMATAPVLHPSIPLTPSAISISSQMRIGVYDCLYVVLADQEQCELITADDKLLNNLQARYPYIRALASLP